LVKRYVLEPGSDAVQSLFQGDTTLATAEIAFAEVVSAFCRRLREGAIATREVDRRVGALQTDWAFLEMIPVSLVNEALPVVLKRHPLRAGDAIHLASALRLREEGALEVTVVSADARLCAAAQAEGLPVHPGLALGGR